MEKEIRNLIKTNGANNCVRLVASLFIHLTARENATFFLLNRLIKMYQLTLWEEGGKTEASYNHVNFFYI